MGPELYRVYKGHIRGTLLRPMLRDHVATFRNPKPPNSKPQTLNPKLTGLRSS